MVYCRKLFCGERHQRKCENGTSTSATNRLSLGQASLLSSRKCKQGDRSDPPGTPLSEPLQERSKNIDADRCSHGRPSQLMLINCAWIGSIHPAVHSKQSVRIQGHFLESTSSRLHASLEEMFLKVHSLVLSMFHIEQKHIDLKHILESFLMHAGWLSKFIVTVNKGYGASKKKRGQEMYILSPRPYTFKLSYISI